MTLHGEPLALAHPYTSLTVGDGLVSQFPALLVSSYRSGVTRAISDGTLAVMFRGFSQHARIYWIATTFLFFLGFLRFPWYVLIQCHFKAAPAFKKEVAAREETKLEAAGKRRRASRMAQWFRLTRFRWNSVMD